MSRVDPQIVEDGPATRVVRRLSPADEMEEIILRTASMDKFRKLALKHGLLFHVQGTLCYSEPTYYLSKGDGHNVGDLKDAGYEFRTARLTMTNGFDFGADGVWYERFPKFRDGTPKPPVFEFDNGRVGGKRSGHRPAAFFTQTTKITEEINRCLQLQ